MSELKAITVYDAYWKANSVGEGTGILVYLKSEADKVIAEKDAEIEKLKQEIERLKQEKFVIEQYKPIQPIELLKPRIMENGCEYYLAGEVRMCIEQVARQIAESNSVYKELDTILKHQKYKRCLAMAEWCNSEMGRETFACFRPRHTKEVWREEHKYWAKWRKIWFELYIKFKEAK